MNRNWSEDLRERMDAHKEPVPEALWNNIEQQLVCEGLIRRDNPKPFNRWSLRVFLAAAVLFAGLFIGYLVPFRLTPDISLAIENQVAVVALLDSLDGSVRNSSATAVTPLTVPKSVVVATLPAVLPETDNRCEAATSAESACERSRDSLPVPSETSADKPDARTTTTGRRNNYDYRVAPTWEPRKTGRTAWSASVYASNIPQKARQQFNGYGAFDAVGGPYEPIFEDEIVGDANSNVCTDINHRQPITFGASVCCGITPRWNVYGSVTYSRLCSRFKFENSDGNAVSEQTLHNIGLSVGVGYTVWQYRNLSVYFGGGGSVEKNVSGKLVTDYLPIAHATQPHRSQCISIWQLQWSLQATAGIQYDLSRTVGLYAEPGASYYFDNGSRIETIYKERPLNFNLTVGVRFVIRHLQPAGS